MKIALVTTTINIPRVLSLYRRIGPDVRFFVAGDEKTPHGEVYKLCDEIGNAVYMDPSWQRDFSGYACSELIGWNNIQRRNIATLEALKWGADLIVSVDDDNIPMGYDYLLRFHCLFLPDHPLWSGLQATSPTGWVDPGAFLLPPVSHRGFPHDARCSPVLSPIVDARIGAAAGYVLGDSDISAVSRLAGAPLCHVAHEAARAGIVVDPRSAWTVFNSQNTAVVRELAPAWFMMPGVGRFDDIFASLVVQRIMRERGLVVHLGQPFVYQQRNEHNLMRDLREERFGMEHIREFSGMLGACKLWPGIVVDQVRYLLASPFQAPWFPKQTIAAMDAWLHDCERVMA